MDPAPPDSADGCGAAVGCQAHAVADVDADGFGLMDGEIAKGAGRRPERKRPAAGIEVFDHPVLHARDGRDRAAGTSVDIPPEDEDVAFLKVCRIRQLVTVHAPVDKALDPDTGCLCPVSAHGVVDVHPQLGRAGKDRGGGPRLRRQGKPEPDRFIAQVLVIDLNCRSGGARTRLQGVDQAHGLHKSEFGPEGRHRHAGLLP